MHKYSRQREVIKEYLTQTYIHPTADEVYQHVRVTHPHISLGTVYRNLNLLADLGEAVKITTPEGTVRFDGHTVPHCHVLCTKCQTLFDLDLKEEEKLEKAAKGHFQGDITGHRLLFYGICDACK